jgi:hypothetical protein
VLRVKFISHNGINDWLKVKWNGIAHSDTTLIEHTTNKIVKSHCNGKIVADLLTIKSFDVTLPSSSLSRYDNVSRKPLKTKKNVTIGLPKSASRGLGIGKWCQTIINAKIKRQPFRA